uniref:Uncharacterized protein n=1 Tax=viral metagenome TaxID=1070528 RepID=A0A6C0L976_9ZZZZ
MGTDVCDEVLENIKQSLLRCQNNKKTYQLIRPFNISNCDNILTFAAGLYATKTQIILKNTIAVEKYSINYNVKERTVELE